MLNASFDLVTIVEVRDNTARRGYSSQSHKTLLGHEPESCNGDMTTLTHLFTEEFLHLQVPLLIAAFEEGSLIDGFTDNVKLVNAAGQTMKFEYRMSLSPTDPRKVGPYHHRQWVLQPPGVSEADMSRYRKHKDDDRLIRQVSVDAAWAKVCEVLSETR